jgi:hypothetical protein
MEIKAQENKRRKLDGTFKQGHRAARATNSNKKLS